MDGKRSESRASSRPMRLLNADQSTWHSERAPQVLSKFRRRSGLSLRGRSSRLRVALAIGEESCVGGDGRAADLERQAAVTKSLRKGQSRLSPGDFSHGEIRNDHRAIGRQERRVYGADPRDEAPMFSFTQVLSNKPQRARMGHRIATRGAAIFGPRLVVDNPPKAIELPSTAVKEHFFEE